MKIKNIFNRKNNINLIYFLLCLFPLIIFTRDFLKISELDNIIGKSFFEILFFSIKQGFLSTILAFLIGIIPGYYAGQGNSWISKILESTIFIPFFFPVISTVTAFSIIFNMDFMKNFNILYTLKGILIGNVFYNSPIFVKYISEGLKSIPPDLRENMELDGASKIEIFFLGEIKIIMAQIIRAALLVFTYSFLSFGIILSLGGIRYSTLEIEISTTFRGQLNFSKGILLGIVQFIFLIIINLVRFYPKEYFVERRNNSKLEKKLEKNIILLKIVSIFYILGEYIVVFSSILFSFYDYYIGKFSLKYYKIIFSQDFNRDYPIIKSIFNTFFIASMVAIVVIWISYILIKNYNKITEIMIFANVGISGAFLGITLYYLNILYNIPLVILVMIGLIIGTVPVAYSFMYQYIKKFPREIYENSLLDCNSIFERFIYVEFPILRKIFISSFLQIFAIVLGEFTLTYTMQLEDMLPLVSLVNYSMVSNKRYLESAAFSSVILIVVIGLFLLGEFLKNKEN